MAVAMEAEAGIASGRPSMSASICGHTALVAPPPASRIWPLPFGSIARKIGGNGEADAFEHGIVEVVGSVAGVEPDKGTAHVGVEKRETLAGEIGQEDEVGRRLVGTCQHPVARVLVDAEDRSRPVARSPRREDRRDLDDQAGARMGEPVDLRCRPARRRRPRGRPSRWCRDRG